MTTHVHEPAVLLRPLEVQEVRCGRCHKLLFQVVDGVIELLTRHGSEQHFSRVPLGSLLDRKEPLP